LIRRNKKSQQVRIDIEIDTEDTVHLCCCLEHLHITYNQPRIQIILFFNKK